MYRDNRYAVPDECGRFERFAADLAASGRRPATLRSYTSDWLDLCRWHRRVHGACFDGATLDADVVAAWRDTCVANQKSPATVSRRIAFARRYAAWLADDGVIDGASTDAIRGVGKGQGRDRAPRILTDTEVHRLVLETDTRACKRDQAIMYTLLDTGVKVGELVALDIGDLDFAASSLRIVGPRVRYVPLPTRSARKIAWSLAERRLLELPESGEIALPPSVPWPPETRVPPPDRSRLPALVSPMPFGTSGDPATWPLFVGERGRLTPNAVQRIVRKYATFARVDGSPHVLRHTFAFALWSRTRDLLALAEILGHENVETTRVYTYVQPDEGPALPSVAPFSSRTRRLAAGR